MKDKSSVNTEILWLYDRIKDNEKTYAQVTDDTFFINHNNSWIKVIKKNGGYYVSEVNTTINVLDKISGKYVTETWRTFYTNDENSVSKAFSVCYNNNTKVSTYYDFYSVSIKNLSDKDIDTHTKTSNVFKIDRYGRVIIASTTNTDKVEQFSKELNNITKKE